MNFELSEGQDLAIQTIIQFVNDPVERIMVLKGYAGTGKTTAIQYAIQAFSGSFSVAFTAPTNKATKVLREMAAAAGVQVDHVATIYSLLGLRLQPSGEIKTIGYGGNSRAGEFDIVVIDEASMVNSRLMEHIETSVSMYDIKVIFMGDPLQLPPVGEQKSKALNKRKYTAELTEIVRQAAGNPIIKLTADIRASILEGGRTFDYASAKGARGQGVYVLPKNKWEAWMMAGFSSKAYVADGDAFRAIAWRNVTVNYLNGRVRNMLYKEHAADPFIEGERVITASPIKDQDDPEGSVLLPTDGEGKILSVSLVRHPHIRDGEFMVWHLQIANEEVGLVDAYALHEKSEKDFNGKLSALSEEAKKDGRLWGTFWEFKDAFADIRPAHAITSHRSQGSTYDNVFVDVTDIMRNRDWTEAMKSLYVSCSRARKNLMLLV